MDPVSSQELLSSFNHKNSFNREGRQEVLAKIAKGVHLSYFLYLPSGALPTESQYTPAFYTDLNSDHAVRFTSTSFRVSSCANPAKQRAISEFR
jgi:hypothetical protein